VILRPLSASSGTAALNRSKSRLGLIEGPGSKECARRKHPELSSAANRTVSEVRKSIDISVALARVGSDKVLLRELAGIFLQECPKTLSEMRNAITGEDCDSLMRAAHTLKGRAAFFGADPVCKLAMRLERMGRTHNLSDGQKAWAALEAEIGQLKSALTALVSEEGHEDPGRR